MSGELREVPVLVPTERIAQLYEIAASWLADSATTEIVEADDSPPVADGERLPWSRGDLELAKEVWGRMNHWAHELFGVLMDHPEQKFSGQQLADDLDYKHGKYGIVGTMAWPGRYCKAVGRQFPIQWEEGPVGESGNYWMTSDVAALFREARDSE